MTSLIHITDGHLTLGESVSRVDVLRGVSLSVSSGESIGIVGPSGSGKSTLLMVMAGLERLDSGDIVVSGEDITTMSEDELSIFRGRTIGIVFQSFHLIPNMTALENVSVPLELSGVSDAFAKAREELSLVGLGDRLSHYPSQLSGGEQQRVAIARALAVDPKIIIADEPTGNLDETSGTQITDLLFSQQSERSATLVLVTHSSDLASRCDRVVRMRDGRIES